MATVVEECGVTALRPVARWISEQDERGRTRLVMAWSVPDPDAALPRLAAAES